MCTLDDNQSCIGCGRSLREIIEWAGMTAEEQQAVIERLSNKERN
jgi:predicted Fe-S protein YdhL (DUF1289 family)